MQGMAGMSVEESGRALRQRNALPPFRPRPEYTSSDRGKANAEVRRQRELEANITFTEANEMISHVKQVASSSFDGDGAQEDAAMESEVDAALSFNASLGEESQGQGSSQTGARGVVTLSKAVPIIASTAEQTSSPLSKKARMEEDLEYDNEEDVVFYEQLVATGALDLENGSSSSRMTLNPTTDGEQEPEEQGYDLVRVLREKHPETNGFRWSSEKQVKVAQKALERGLNLIAKIKMEVDREDVEVGSESSSSSTLPPAPRRPPPGRTVLAPLANSTLNRQLGAARVSSNMQTAQEGKRKLQEEAETSQTPAAPIRPSSTLLSTPDRRLPSVRPTGSPLSQTPNPARSTLRLGTTLRTSTPIQSTPFALTPNKASNAIPRTPRISLGMTPRRAVSGSVPKFKTPFKDSGLRKETPTGTQRSPDLFKIPPANRGVSSPSVMGGPSVKRPTYSSVRPSIFDIDKKMAERQSYRSMGFRPESTSIEDVENNLSPEVFDAIEQILRKPKRGLKYAFGVEGEFVGREGVHVMLTQELGTHEEIPRQWIDNHYILILWKLAAYTRHLLDENYWTWEEVCRQFRYRYEREFNCKHRSAVKRIFREDSPSTRPMVLCVFEILPFDERQGHEQTVVLTDGWYRIQAVVDRVLCLAIYGKKFQGVDAKTPLKPARKEKRTERESAAFAAASSASKDREENEEDVEDDFVCPPYTTEPDMIRIKVGTKLAIQGARLESDAEGSDPLRAFDHARLSIAGNTTKLAVWDAKLGFTRGSFIGTIRSLSAGGGNIPLMDIVVTRLYPVAYTGADICPGYEDDNSGFIAEWNQAEEEERRQAWEKHREKAINDLQEELEEETQELRRICEQLEEAYMGMSHEDFDDAIDASSCKDMLHAIIVAGSASGYLGMVQVVPKLRELAYKKLQEVRERLEGEIETNLLSRLGSRNVRSFRFIRFRDANPSDHNRVGIESLKQEQCQRGVLLRIWDYAERIEAGCDVAQSEGDHFMVSNLTPSRTGAWPRTDGHGDIELTSTKLSIWRMIKRGAKAESSK